MTLLYLYMSLTHATLYRRLTKLESHLCHDWNAATTPMRSYPLKCFRSLPIGKSIKSMTRRVS